VNIDALHDTIGTAAPVARADRTGSGAPGAAVAVTSLYQAHSVQFLRLAVIMLGDRAAAEDVVQEAFCSLYRRWRHLSDREKALAYVRSAVLNGCRSQLRTRIRAERRRQPMAISPAASAEEDALLADEHQSVLKALRALPRRQREALVLRVGLTATIYANHRRVPLHLPAKTLDAVW
jgi:RNA polymerase sigma factor (sigma-70 family)